MCEWANKTDDIFQQTTSRKHFKTKLDSSFLWYFSNQNTIIHIYFVLFMWVLFFICFWSNLYQCRIKSYQISLILLKRSGFTGCQFNLFRHTVNKTKIKINQQVFGEDFTNNDFYFFQNIRTNCCTSENKFFFLFFRWQLHLEANIICPWS